MKIRYEEHIKDRIEMPIFDESIFFPEIKRCKLGITDEDMKYIIEFFRWQLDQRNRRMSCQCIMTILKLRMEKLIHQKRSELSRELEAFQNFL